MIRSGLPSLSTAIVCLATVSCCLWLPHAAWAGETLAERRARIENMDPTQKAELLRAQEQFAALDPQDKQRLRRLHEQIEKHPRSRELLDLMERYCQWANTLPAYERAQLSGLAPAERIEKIKQLRQQQLREQQSSDGQQRRWRGRGFASGEWLRRMAWEEREGLSRWVDDYMDRSATELFEALPKAWPKRLVEEFEQAKDDPGRRRLLFAEMWAAWRLTHPAGPLPLGDQAFEDLKSHLSPAARRSLEEKGPDDQRRVFADLISAIAFIHSHEQLGEYLQKELPPEQWDRLTNLPPEASRWQLWALYLSAKWPEMRSHFPGPGRWRPGGPFRGSRTRSGSPPRGPAGDLGPRRDRHDGMRGPPSPDNRHEGIPKGPRPEDRHERSPGRAGPPA